MFLIQSTTEMSMDHCEGLVIMIVIRNQSIFVIFIVYLPQNETST